MALTLRTHGLEGLKKRSRDREKKLKNFQIVNKKAATVIFGWIQRNFNAEGGLHESSRFGPWKQLKPATIARRRKGKGAGGAKILQDKGRLKGGFQVSATNRQGVVRNRVVYGRTHEEGRGKIPQRKMLPTGRQGTKIVFPVYRRHVRVATK